MTSAWRLVLATYTPDKRRWDRIYPWIGYVLRPASFLVTVPLIGLGVTANQVTAFTGILGLIGCALLAWGTPQGFVWGGLCITLLNLFDCVDGNLARFGPGAGPPVGRFYDQLVGYFFPLSYFFLGLGLAQSHPSWSLALATAGGATTILKLMVGDVRRDFRDVLEPAWQEARAEGRVAGQGHAYRWYTKCYYNATDIGGHDFLLWSSALAGWLPLFLVASLFLAVVEFLFILVFHLCRAARL